MAFDKLAPGVKPSDVSQESERSEECDYCGAEVYGVGTDPKHIGEAYDFCDGGCRTRFVEERWYEAIQNDEPLTQLIQNFIKEEMI